MGAHFAIMAGSRSIHKKSGQGLVHMIFNFLYYCQTYFLPVIGLVEPADLSPGDLVVRNKFAVEPPE